MLSKKYAFLFTKFSFIAVIIIAVIFNSVNHVFGYVYSNMGTDIIVYANSDDNTEVNEEIVPWSSEAMGTSYAHSLNYKGDGVNIACIDSGLDIYSEVNVCGSVDFEDPEYCRGDDLTGHGSAVAGVIAAPENNSGIVGIAPEASIYNLRVLDSANEAPVSRIINALDWCLNNDIDIINMSFGTDDYSPALWSKINEVYQHDIIMISSAGNGENMQYPAVFPGVLSVSSVDSSMQKVENAASGEALDFVAPGKCVYSTSLIGGYCAVSGTSIAAAHITGCAAVLLSRDTTKSSSFIRDLLIYSCKNLGSKVDFGYGIPDLEFALDNYDSFSANYNENNDYTAVNASPVDNFFNEDCYVDGQWDDTGHAAIIQFYFDHVNFNIRFPLLLKKVSNSMDSRNYLRPNYNGYSDSNSFHAVGNYVITAKLLYEIAVNYKVQGVSNFSHDSNSSYAPNNYSFNKCYRFSDLSSFLGGEENYKKIMANISDMLVFYENTNIINENKMSGETDFISVSEKTSTIVMGMLLHLLGDLYAHRTVVPPSASSIISCNSHEDNEGKYFVRKDFNTKCGKEHTITSKIDKKEELQKRVTSYYIKYKNSTGLFKVVYLMYFLIWSYFGSFLLNHEIYEYNKPKQEKEDKNLLKKCQNIPSNENTSYICNGKLCFDALTRINRLGVLQFKDIKYFLAGKENNTNNYSVNRAYYEDPKPNNLFYGIRFLAAKATVKLFCADFYNSSSSNGMVAFKPIQLLPRSTETDTNIKNYCLKLDCFYNYLKNFDDSCPSSQKSVLLTKDYWDSVEDNLFRYTTIYTNEGYFVDPATYTNEDRQNMIYRSSSLISNEDYKNCEDYYNS